MLQRGADVDLSLLSEEPSSSENETDDASWHGVDETPEESKERALRFLTWVIKKKNTFLRTFLELPRNNSPKVVKNFFLKKYYTFD